PRSEEGVRVFGFHQAGENRFVNRIIAFAAASGDDHVGAREDLGVTFYAGTLECEPRRVGAKSLPRLHLPLIAFLRNLPVQLDAGEWMHEIGSEGLVIDLVGTGSESIQILLPNL